MMKKRKLGIIGGSGLYKMEGLKKLNGKKLTHPWGKPSDEILIAKLGKRKICFIPDIPEVIKLILLILILEQILMR